MKNMRSVSVFAILLVVLLGGCATTIETLEGERLRIDSPQFRDYALGVFKRNNSTLTTLFDVLEQVDDADAARLDQAELRMIEACETLNSAAAAQRDGKKLGVRILRTISSTVRPCDEATHETNQLIQEITAVSLLKAPTDAFALK